MNRKSLIGTLVLLLVLAAAVLVIRQPAQPLPNKEKTGASASASTPPVAMGSPSLAPKATPTVNEVETDQTKVEAEMNSIPYNEVGEVKASPNGKKILSIDGRQIMEAYDFVFRDKHQSGVVLIGARTEAGKSLAKFDYATDVENGKSKAASDSLWVLAKNGSLQRITPVNFSIQSARLSVDGQRLAYTVIERDTNGFKTRLSLRALDRQTGISKVVSGGTNSADTLMPLRWESNNVLRVFSASEHGGGMRLENVVID